MSGERDANDWLLYLGAAALAGVGLAWLALARPWAGGSAIDETVARRPAAPAEAPPAAPPARPAPAERGVDELLRLAGLARTAGMLVEPPRYSAWALYSDVLAAEPGNSSALDGMQRVADMIVARASTAFEQDRLADARDGVETVLARLPEHAGAQQLAADIEARSRAAARARAAPRVRAEPTSPEGATDVTPIQAAAPVRADHFEMLRNAFDDALGAGRLLAPELDSAKHFLARLTEFDADNPSVTSRREALVGTLLDRAAQAMRTLDAAAAETWIDEAAGVGAAPERIDRARADLTARLVAAESQKPLPAAELTLVDYTPPRFPASAANLGIEGWVDVEFVVATDGTTSGIAVTAGSHEDLFHDEAVAAVRDWRFEPRIFLGRPIPQKTYTRIRFELE